MIYTYKQRLSETESDVTYMREILNEIEEKLEAVDAVQSQGDATLLGNLRDRYLDVWEAFHKLQVETQDVVHKISDDPAYLARETLGELEYQEWQKEVA